MQQKAGSKGTTYESSYSKFATGIPLWDSVPVHVQRKWNWQKNYDEELVADLYGDAAPALKLFGNFLFQAQFVPAEMDKWLNYLQEAQTLSTDHLVLQRLNELKLTWAMCLCIYNPGSLKRGS
jgi:hypothetical protein